MQVLVADDDPVYRSLLKDLLTGWHFDVAMASDGEEAWEILQRDDAPNLVLLDWMMPRLDGFELCRKIQSQYGRKNMYILMITGSRKKEELMKVIVSGANDYLIKPFDPVDLKIHLRNAMRVLDLQAELDELRRSRPATPATRT